nr:unnamed protein product [Naegleria fowleri]
MSSNNSHDEVTVQLSGGGPTTTTTMNNNHHSNSSITTMMMKSTHSKPNATHCVSDHQQQHPQQLSKYFDGTYSVSSHHPTIMNGMNNNNSSHGFPPSSYYASVMMMNVTPSQPSMMGSVYNMMMMNHNTPQQQQLLGDQQVSKNRTNSYLNHNNSNLIYSSSHPSSSSNLHSNCSSSCYDHPNNNNNHTQHPLTTHQQHLQEQHTPMVPYNSQNHVSTNHGGTATTHKINNNTNPTKQQPQPQPPPPPPQHKLLQQTKSSESCLFTSCTTTTTSTTSTTTLPKQMVQNFEFDTPASRYKVTDIIGNGTYGVVAIAMEQETQTQVALKKNIRVFPNREHTTSSDKYAAFNNSGKLHQLRMLRELKILHHMRQCPYIVSLRDVHVPTSMDQLEDIEMVTSLMEADLRDIFDSGQYLSPKHIKWFMYQIVLSVYYMQKAHILHRDLKPENVLLNSQCDVSICDFGLARGFYNSRKHRSNSNLNLASTPNNSSTGTGSSGGIFTSVVVGHNNPTTTTTSSIITSTTTSTTTDPILLMENNTRLSSNYVVSRWYRPPELLTNAPHIYNKTLDMWSVGCIMYELLSGTGEVLFKGTGSVDQIKRIVKQLGTPNLEDFNGSDSARDFVFNKLPFYRRRSFTKRLPANTCPMAIDLMKRMLVFNMYKRITPEEALMHPYFREFYDVNDLNLCSDMKPFDTAWEDDMLTSEDLKREAYHTLCEIKRQILFEQVHQQQQHAHHDVPHQQQEEEEEDGSHQQEQQQLLNNQQQHHGGASPPQDHLCHENDKDMDDHHEFDPHSHPFLIEYSKESLSSLSSLPQNTEHPTSNNAFEKFSYPTTPSIHDTIMMMDGGTSNDGGFNNHGDAAVNNQNFNNHNTMMTTTTTTTTTPTTTPPGNNNNHYNTTMYCNAINDGQLSSSRLTTNQPDFSVKFNLFSNSTLNAMSGLGSENNDDHDIHMNDMMTFSSPSVALDAISSLTTSTTTYRFNTAASTTQHSISGGKPNGGVSSKHSIHRGDELIENSCATFSPPTVVNISYQTTRV